MSDKHLFRKKKNDAVEPETIAPDVETQDMENLSLIHISEPTRRS